MSIRHFYYFDMIDLQKELYEQQTKPHYKLMRYVASDKNILLSIKLVGENSGRNTPGIDGLRFDDIKLNPPKNLIKKIRNKIYHGYNEPSKRVYIPKGKNQTRPLGINTILDKIVQQCFLNILEPICEAGFSEHSCGFRTGVDGITKTQQILWTQFRSMKGGHRYVIDIDLENYFDTINRDIVLDILRETFNIKDTFFLKRLKNITINHWIENNKYNRSKVGIPQGSVLGPIFSNILLHRLDKELEDLKMNKKETKMRKTYMRKHSWAEFRHKNRDSKISFEFARFADDIRLVTNTKSECDQLMKVIERYCDNYHIKLSKSKTKIERVRKVEMVGRGIKTNGNSQVRYFSNPKKIKKTINKRFREYQRTGNVGPLISSINGFIYVGRSTTNLKWLINHIDYRMFLLDYRKGRHQGKIKINKVKDGHKSRTYELQGNYRWYEIDLWKLREETKDTIRFIEAGHYTDRFNPDGNWYNVMDFLNNTNSGYSIYIPGLLHKQKFKCAKSKRKLTPYNFHVHHKKPKSKGGDDSFNNLELIHRSEHAKIHKTHKI